MTFSPTVSVAYLIHFQFAQLTRLTILVYITYHGLSMPAVEVFIISVVSRISKIRQLCCGINGHFCCVRNRVS